MSDSRPKFSLRPQTRRGLLLTILGSVVAVAVIAFLLIYFVIFPTSSPAPFSLTTKTSTTKPRTPAGSAGQLSGHWTIASGSEAGYRVREKLAFLPAESEAVGRTSSITGGATFAAANGRVRITAASFDVAVNTLKSDRTLRDEKIREIGLESNRYPSATFVLSSAVVLPASALNGRAVHTAATGLLAIHGTTRRETIPLEMSLSGEEVQAVGSITFPWGKFNMVAPSIGGFVNVTDKATMEFDLHLAHA
jgi:polyisoprenoid-binding protein YceI